MRVVLYLYSRISRLVSGMKNVFFDRGWVKPRRAPLPVISVGNITMGGTGKTPAAVEILEFLLKNGFQPALVTRGYKGKWEKRGGVLSDGKSLLGGWREGGDEPFMVALRIPRAGVFVGRRRLSSCLVAAEAGFNVAVLDDGFQHRKLHRDLDIVLHDPGKKTALREPHSAMKRADIILFPEGAREEAERLLNRKAPESSAYAFSVVPLHFNKITENPGGDETRVAPENFRGAGALAFCGMAGPERFFLTLENFGFRLLEKLAFPDHHGYPARSWTHIRDRCRVLKPEVVVTTEKDAVKLAGRPGVPGDVPLFALRVGLKFQPGFFDAVAGFMRRAAGGGS